MKKYSLGCNGQMPYREFLQSEDGGAFSNDNLIYEDEDEVIVFTIFENGEIDGQIVVGINEVDDAPQTIHGMKYSFTSEDYVRAFEETLIK